MMLNTQTILQGYVACALWSSTDDNDEPLDDGRDMRDLPAETLAKMHDDVTKFVARCMPDLHRSALNEAQIGHDFWLTRNGHGAGFWDRDLGPVGDKLTKVCDEFKEVWLYLGDDGLIYQA